MGGRARRGGGRNGIGANIPGGGRGNPVGDANHNPPTKVFGYGVPTNPKQEYKEAILDQLIWIHPLTVANTDRPEKSNPKQGEGADDGGRPAQNAIKRK